MNGHVLGLDLSLTETGWATVTPDGTHQCGVVRTTTATGSLEVRLDEICTMAANHADGSHLVVIERPFVGKGGGTGFAVWGAVIHHLYGAGRTGHRVINDVPPQSLKVFACGSGNATGGSSKSGPSVQAGKRLGYDGGNNNEIDALWLAHLGWHLLGEPVVDLPATHTRALSAPWAKGWPGYVTPVAKARKKKAAT
jgi:hypothetical protein